MSNGNGDLQKWILGLTLPAVFAAGMFALGVLNVGTQRQIANLREDLRLWRTEAAAERKEHEQSRGHSSLSSQVDGNSAALARNAEEIQRLREGRP